MSSSSSTSSRPPTSLSTSSSSSSGRSTRVNGSRAPCSSVQGGAAPSERQSEAIKGNQGRSHLLEEELLGGRDGALRLEIAARLMRVQSEASSEAIRGHQAGAPRLQLAWALISACRRFSSEAHAAATAACGEERGWGGRRGEHLHARAGPQWHSTYLLLRPLGRLPPRLRRFRPCARRRRRRLRRRRLRRRERSAMPPVGVERGRGGQVLKQVL